MALAGKISVRTMGPGIVSPGETDRGVSSIAEEPGGKPEWPPCEQAATNARKSRPKNAGLRMAGRFRVETAVPRTIACLLARVTMEGSDV